MSPFPLEGGRTGWGCQALRSCASALRRLRREMTPHERLVWQRLRRGSLGCRFRRQHVLGHTIVDFVCLEKRLIIEIDGDHHDDQRQYDEKRTRWLNQEGYRVLRFTNTEVQRQLDDVLERIHLETHGP